MLSRVSRSACKQSGNTLSGGEQQMLAIARCLMMRPKLIILDEPTEGIMPRLVSQIRREIHRINQTGVSILLVEQNVETALQALSARVSDGKGHHRLQRCRARAEVAARDRAPLPRAVETVRQSFSEGEHSMKQRKVTRRSFLETALKGGALAGTASLTITKDLFAQASGPIVIGHHCDLTGVISSWGFWHDKCAKAAVDIINKGGGIAGRKVELATEDTESNPGTGRAQAAQPDPARQRRVHRRLGAFRRDAGGAADRLRAQDARTSRPARRPR